MKWRQKNRCSLRRENKRGIIFRKCWLRTRATKDVRKRKKRDKDSKILKLRMNTPKCLTNKKMIEEMN